MTDKQQLTLRRKYTFQASGKKVVFFKKAMEHERHVVMKALLWGLYLPQYPEIQVEVPVGGKYKPDLVQLNHAGKPVFWAEAGRVGDRKIKALVKRYPATHLVFAKWDQNLAPLFKQLRKAAAPVRRSAPVELISFPPDSAAKFIKEGGVIEMDEREFKRLLL